MMFSGICIGGPSDGKNITSSHPTMHVAIRPDLESQRWTGAFPVRIEARKQQTYVFLPLWGMQTGFWVPESVSQAGIEKANRYVISKLIDHYAERAQD